MLQSIIDILRSPPLPLPIFLPLLFTSAFTLFVAGYVFRNLFLHPLRDVPGPLVARALPFYPLYRYYKGDMTDGMNRLHNQYGPHVRISPNHVAVAAEGGQKQIWAKDFEKGNFYDAYVTNMSKHRDLFTIRNNKEHGQRKRIFANIWSMTSVLEMESHFDRMIELFCQKIGKVADEGKPLDLGLWTWRFTFDLVGELFFGNPFGFLEEERDVDELMAAAGSVAPFEGLMGMAPPWFRPFMVWMVAIPKIAAGISNMKRMQIKAKKIVGDRLKQISEGKDERNDMIGKMLQIVHEKGEKYDWTTNDVEQECLIAMIAGNDTVSIELTATLYYLAKNSETLVSLQKELDEAEEKGELSPIMTYKEASQLPYLCAVLNEGYRMHPLFGFPVPRIVPPGGADVGGRWFPGGTFVGVSCGTPEKLEGVFGSDALEWRPERWLVERDEHVKMWDDVSGFGTGVRACIGQHIARCEMTKLIGQMARQFSFETKDELRSKEHLFNKPQNCMVKITRRTKA